MKQRKWNPSEHSNFDKELLYHEMEHIRLIHFSLIATCVTIIFLIIANWTNMPELIEEITKATNSAIAVDNNNPDELMRHAPNLLKNCTSMADKSIERQLDVKIINPSFLFKRTGSTLRFNNDNAKITYGTTLLEMRNKLTMPGLIDCIQDIEISTEVRDWVVSAKASVKFPLTDIAIPWYFTTFEVIQYKPLLWPTSDTAHGEIVVTLQLTHHNMTSFSSSGSSDSTGSSTNLSLVREFTLSFRSTSYSITRDMFEQEFTKINSNWKTIASMESSAAINWAYEKRAGDLPNKTYSIIGIDIPGQFLGIFCAIAFILALLYIFAYLRQIANFIASHPDPNCIFPFSSPWLGAATHLPTRIVSMISLSLPPVISAILLARNLHPLYGKIYGAVLTITILILSIIIWYYGLLIARMTVANQRSQQLII